MGCLLARKIKKLVWYVTTGSTYTPQPPARAVSPSLAERWRLGCVPPSLEERRGARPWEVAPLNAGLFPSFLGKRDLSYPTRVGRQSEFPASRAPARQPILTEIPKKCKKKKIPDLLWYRLFVQFVPSRGHWDPRKMALGGGASRLSLTSGKARRRLGLKAPLSLISGRP